MNQAALIQQLISQMLGYVPGVGPLLDQFSPMLTQWLSPSSSMANRFIWADAGETLSNTAVRNLNDVIDGSFGNRAAASSSELHLRALDQFNRMLNPGRSKEEIRTMSEAMANNPMNLISLGMSQLDPYGANQGMAEATKLASTIQRVSGGPVSLKGAQYAADISETIFGKDGKSGMVKDIIDNPKLYGNMKISEVMQVGQELIRTDSTGFNNNGKFDSAKFKQSIKSMSQALQPWKDIFGTDIPELMNQLEALTGQGISVQRSTLKASGSRMASVMQATGANVQNIAAYKQVLASSMQDPTMSNRASLGAHSVASDMIMGTANSGRMSMTTAEFQQEAGTFYSRSAASKFADNYALAYAKWSNETKEAGFQAAGTMRRKAYEESIANGNSHEAASKHADRVVREKYADLYSEYDKNVARGMTHEEAEQAASETIKTRMFEKKYNDLLAQGYSRDEALRRASGAKSSADYEVYRNTKAHLDTLKSGDSARRARDEIMRETRKGFIKDYIDNEGQYKAGSAEVRSKLGKLSDTDFNEFMGMTKDDKVEFLQKKGIIDNKTSREEAFRIVNDIQAAYGKSFTAATGQYTTGERASTIAQTYVNEKKNEVKAQEYEKFSDAVRRLSAPDGMQGLLKTIEESDGKANVTDLIKSYTGGVDILDAVIEAGMFKDKDGKVTSKLNTKAIRNAAHFALNNYATLATEYKDIYNDINNGNDPVARERGMKTMAALGALGQRQLAAMSPEQRGEFIAKIKGRAASAGKDTDMEALAKDTYIDYKLGSTIERYEKNASKPQKAALKAIRNMLENSTTTSVDQVMDMAKKMGLDHDTATKIIKESGISDVDGTEPLARLCNVLEGLAGNIKDLINNLPVGA